MLFDYRINEYADDELRSFDIYINDDYVGLVQYIPEHNKIYIHEIEIEFRYRNRGIATKVINDITSMYNIYTLYGLAVPEAKEFWRKLGAEIEEGEGERIFRIYEYKGE